MRFHGAQSILVSLALIALYIPLTILGFNLDHVRLPVIGAMAEPWATRP